jgi:hypothetical protein
VRAAAGRHVRADLQIQPGASQSAAAFSRALAESSTMGGRAGLRLHERVGIIAVLLLRAAGLPQGV